MADILINIEAQRTVIQTTIPPSVDVLFPGKKGEKGDTGDMSVEVSDIDGQFSGIPIPRTLGEALSFGDFVRFSGADGRAWKGDSRSISTMPVVGVVVAGGGAGEAGTVLLVGSITKTSWAWNPGGILYASEGGAVTQVPISGTGSQGQVVGVAITPKTILVNPAYVLVEVA